MTETTTQTPTFRLPDPCEWQIAESYVSVANTCGYRLMARPALALAFVPLSEAPLHAFPVDLQQSIVANRCAVWCYVAAITAAPSIARTLSLCDDDEAWQLLRANIGLLRAPTTDIRLFVGAAALARAGSLVDGPSRDRAVRLYDRLTRVSEGLSR